MLSFSFKGPIVAVIIKTCKIKKEALVLKSYGSTQIRICGKRLQNMHRNKFNSIYVVQSKKGFCQLFLTAMIAISSPIN